MLTAAALFLREKLFTRQEKKHAETEIKKVKAWTSRIKEREELQLLSDFPRFFIPTCASPHLSLPSLLVPLWCLAVCSVRRDSVDVLSHSKANARANKSSKLSHARVNLLQFNNKLHPALALSHNRLKPFKYNPHSVLQPASRAAPSSVNPLHPCPSANQFVSNNASLSAHQCTTHQPPPQLQLRSCNANQYANNNVNPRVCSNSNQSLSANPNANSNVTLRVTHHPPLRLPKSSRSSWKSSKLKLSASHNASSSASRRVSSSNNHPTSAINRATPSALISANRPLRPLNKLSTPTRTLKCTTHTTIKDLPQPTVPQPANQPVTTRALLRPPRLQPKSSRSCFKPLLLNQLSVLHNASSPASSNVCSNNSQLLSVNPRVSRRVPTRAKLLSQPPLPVSRAHPPMDARASKTIRHAEADSAAEESEQSSNYRVFVYIETI